MQEKFSSDFSHGKGRSPIIKTPAQQNTENHNHRIWFSYIAFAIAVLWLVFVGFTIYSFFMVTANSSVMIALLTTSTATVVGLPYLVLQGTYGTKQNLKHKSNNPLNGYMSNN